MNELPRVNQCEYPLLSEDLLDPVLNIQLSVNSRDLLASTATHPSFVHDYAKEDFYLLHLLYKIFNGQTNVSASFITSYIYTLIPKKIYKGKTKSHRQYRIFFFVIKNIKNENIIQTVVRKGKAN